MTKSAGKSGVTVEKNALFILRTRSGLREFIKKSRSITNSFTDMGCLYFRKSLLLLKTGKPIPLQNTNLHSGALNLIRAQYRVVPPKDKL